MNGKQTARPHATTSTPNPYGTVSEAGNRVSIPVPTSAASPTGAQPPFQRTYGESVPQPKSK